MTRDQIVKWAQEAGIMPPGWGATENQWCSLERFAALVADHVYAKYLEQPEPQLTGVISITIPEPIGYLCENAVGHKYFRWKKPSSTYKPIALYTAPREWVGLTDEEYEAMAEQYLPNCYFHTLKYAKAIEAKLKEKNG